MKRYHDARKFNLVYELAMLLLDGVLGSRLPYFMLPVRVRTLVNVKA
jgi:hypothetical protein